MAIINIDLLSGETVIDSTNASDGDTIDLNVIDSGTLIVDGVDVSISNLVGVGAASSPTFAAQNGGSLTLDQGLLNADLLTNTTFEVRDSGTVTLDASTLSVGLTETVLNEFNVEFTGEYHTGKFVYDPPAVSLLVLNPQTLNVSGMQATDIFEVDGRTNFQLDSSDPEDAYRDGVLHLTSPGTPLLAETVNVEIPMTRAEFDLFLSDQSTYLNGDTFIFPGTLATPCFCRGTLILTDEGEVPVEELRAGDIVMTRDHGPQPIEWIGSRHLGPEFLDKNPKLLPIRISAGALGAGLPSRDLVVSPQHRILVRSRIAQRMFGASEVLVAAKQLLQLDGIDIAHDLAEAEYFHILFRQHEVVISNGAETESLYTGPEALKSVGAQALQEIFSLFPQLRARDYSAVPARSLLSGRQGRKLAVRHAANGRALVS